MRFRIALASIALAASALATSAHAGTLVGSIALGSAATGNSTSLATDTSFTFSTFKSPGTANINALAGNYTAITVATATVSPMTLGGGITLTFGPDGTFMSTSSTFTRTSSGSTSFLNVTFLGTFTASGALASFSPSASSLSLSFSEGAPGASLGVAYSLNSPPVGIPEPASVVMAGLGLVGIAGVSLKARRKSAVVS